MHGPYYFAERNPCHDGTLLRLPRLHKAPASVGAFVQAASVVAGVAERLRLLDLYCGAGGAGAGYARAGFDVVGVDIAPQPRYPFEFVQADALEYLAQHGHRFDVVHASPPCPRYSVASKSHNGRPDEHPDLVAPTRDLLRGRPYVIENVVGAPLEAPITLCGVAFPELRVIRHRLFESNLPLRAPEHRRHPLCFTMDKRKPHYGKLDPWRDYVHVNGGGNAPVAAKRAAMGIDWPMIGREANDAVPPAYTEFLGRQIRELLR
jgi:DNA (cytosine-5)-methyltransferase 1